MNFYSSVRPRAESMAFVMKRLVTSSLEARRHGFAVRGVKLWGRLRPETDLRPGKREMWPTAEAMQMASDLKRDSKRAESSSNVDEVVKAHCKRMIRYDYITVLQTLERDNEVDICLKVFEMMRKESWYKPNSQLYEFLMSLVSKHKRMDDWKRLFKELQEEKGEPSLDMFTVPFRECLSRGDFVGCMEFYETVKEVECKELKPEFYLFCVRRLNEAEQFVLAEQAAKDLSAVQESKY